MAEVGHTGLQKKKSSKSSAGSARHLFANAIFRGIIQTGNLDWKQVLVEAQCVTKVEEDGDILYFESVILQGMVKQETMQPRWYPVHPPHPKTR